MWWLRPTEAGIAIGHRRATRERQSGPRGAGLTHSVLNRRSASVAPLVSEGGDPLVSEPDLMERSLRIERAARVRAEQAARNAKAAIATAETLRIATVKTAAAHLEAGMARQARAACMRCRCSVHVVHVQFACGIRAWCMP